MIPGTRGIAGGGGTIEAARDYGAHAESARRDKPA